MRIATYNVNGINGRIEILLRWLDETKPDVVCLQELKAPEDKFPIRAIESAGYGAICMGSDRGTASPSYAGARILCSHARGFLAIPTIPIWVH